MITWAPRAAGRITWVASDAVELGHRHVHEHHVGLELGGEADGLLAVVGLAHDVEPLLGQRSAEALAEHPVVVGQQQPDRHLATSQACDRRVVHRASSVQRTRVPRPGSESTSERGADAGRPLPHAEEAVAVEPPGAADREPDAVVGDLQPGLGAVAAPGDRDLGGLGVAFHVGDRLLGDPPQLPLLEDGEPAGLLRPRWPTRPLRSFTRSRNASSVVDRLWLSVTSVRRS